MNDIMSTVSIQTKGKNEITKMIRDLMKVNYSKSLIALSMTLQLVSCSGSSEDLGTATNTIGTGTVNWTAPAAREDGNPLSLSDINGYRVYYGSASGDYINSIDVNDSTAQEATVTAIQGLYYYVVTCIDTAGRESLYSPEFEITI